MKSVNICIIEGLLDSDVRFKINDEMACDQADFYVMSFGEDHKGKVYNERVLCRVFGFKAKPISKLERGARLVLDGKLKYSSFLGYVEAINVSL